MRPAGLEQAHYRQRRHAFAAAGLTDEAKRLALFKIDAHAVNDIDDAFVGFERNREIFD